MEERVYLRYPNGRIHEATIDRGAPLKAGDVFEMYGRRWRATQPDQKQPRRYGLDRDTPMLCACLAPEE
jgi:hypothetical protein